MLRHIPLVKAAQSGFTLLEVLVSIVVLAFGLLGLASLQSSMHLAEVEAYQRTQALLILQDFSDRIRSNAANASSYVTGTSAPIGTGDSQPSSCTSLTGSARDLCELSAQLKGASENRNSVASGAMIDGRACVEQLQATNAAAGICTPGIYRATVVWQGLNRTTSPRLLCGKDSYGNDGLRRAVSSVITVGLPRCS